MTTANPAIIKKKPGATNIGGVRLHRFTVDEYHRMAEFGVFKRENPIELLEGRLYIKLDYGPPYDVPLGIPPEEIAGPDVEPYPQRRFTVREYHKLLDSGALHPALRTELVEGWVVDKMTRNARHDSTLQRAAKSFLKRLGKKWEVRVQMAVTMDEGEPEPDIAVVRGPAERFDESQPRPSDVALLIEVSDSTLSYDRGAKLRGYARNGIHRYLILNVLRCQVEDYEDPTGPIDQPNYRSRRIYKNGETIPLILDGKKHKSIPVDDIIKPI